MKLFKIVFFQWFILIASYKFCHAVSYKFFKTVTYTAGIPSDVTFKNFEFPVAVLIREEGSDQFRLVLMKQIAENGNDDDYVIEKVFLEFLISQVEINFSYATMANIKITQDSYQRYYHFQFDEEADVQKFLVQISPLPTENDIKLLSSDILEVTRIVEDFSNEPSTLVNGAAIYVRSNESYTTNTFTVRGPLTNDVRISYLIFEDNDFRISEPFGTNNTKVLLFLSRALELKYIFNFDKKEDANDFAKKMVDFGEEDTFIPYHDSWATY